jgi:hypothetical protein
LSTGTALGLGWFALAEADVPVADDGDGAWLSIVSVEIPARILSVGEDATLLLLNSAFEVLVSLGDELVDGGMLAVTVFNALIGVIDAGRAEVLELELELELDREVTTVLCPSPILDCTIALLIDESTLVLLVLLVKSLAELWEDSFALDEGEVAMLETDDLTEPSVADLPEAGDVTPVVAAGF